MKLCMCFSPKDAKEIRYSKVKQNSTLHIQKVSRAMAAVDSIRLCLLHLLQAFLLGAGIVMVALVAAVMLGTDRAPTPLAAEVFKH